MIGNGLAAPILETLEHSCSGNMSSRYTKFEQAGNLTQGLASTDSTSVKETRIYDDLNQLTENVIDDGSTPATWVFTYDLNGNLTSKTHGTTTTTTTTYLWDEDNRLLGVELNSVAVISYEYDSASRLIQRDYVTASPSQGGTTTTGRRRSPVYHCDDRVSLQLQR